MPAMDLANIDDFFLEDVRGETEHPPPEPPAGAPSEFNEGAYLRAFPEVARAVGQGVHQSGWDHFVHHGRLERRLQHRDYVEALTGVEQPHACGAVALGIDVVLMAENGMVFVVGWIDDRLSPLASLSVFPGEDMGWNTTSLARCRRRDVEAALDAPDSHAFGFWCLLEGGAAMASDAPWRVRLRRRDGGFAEATVTCRPMPSLPLRDTVLGYCASAEYWGNRDVEALAGFDTGLGDALVRLNRHISGTIKRLAHVERYGPARRPLASIVVCLFGKPEFLFLQAALFSAAPGAADYEYIYVSNSPELAETLDKEARIAATTYGLSLVLVTLPANAGFSAANNIAASFASSDRVLIVNPDVFPRNADWAGAHAALLDERPEAETRAFGVPLFYDDGSLMHAGMYFEVDRGLSVKREGIAAREMIRVEHYGKGAPPDTPGFLRARPVPAITGAFMSFDRAWFETLGGFNEDHLFGHYEDADLCLKSLDRGTPVWLHPLPFWHLEGKGSERRPQHAGGSLVNRWLFTRNWGALVRETLVGRRPAHPALRAGAEAAQPAWPRKVAVR